MTTVQPSRPTAERGVHAAGAASGPAAASCEPGRIDLLWHVNPG
jgi:hypothetical protein